MKILVVQDRLRSGGTERQSILLTRAFRKAGHDTSLLLFRPGGALASEIADLPHESLQRNDLHLDWFAPGLYRAVRRTAAAIVLCMGRMANCYAGSMQAAFPNAAVVSTMRTGKKLPWLFRRSLARVRHIVANSEDAREALVGQYHVSASRVSVIHNSLVFPNLLLTGEPNVELRRRHGVDEKTPVLLWVGMFRPEKNQRELIDILANLPSSTPWRMWFAGDGPTRQLCEALAASKNIAERVTFLGFQADPRPYYRAADIAVLTSRSESLSNFLIEAHAHGLPSVAFRAQGVAECGGRVIEPGDHPAFQRSLLELLADPLLRKAEGATRAEYAASHFSPEAQVARYLALFERLVSTSGP
jgi:glycosyltransferase involved in cell wall biosynthesis